MNPYGEILLRAMAAASVTYFVTRIAMEAVPAALAAWSAAN